MGWDALTDASGTQAAGVDVGVMRSWAGSWEAGLSGVKGGNGVVVEEQRVSQMDVAWAGAHMSLQAE